MNFMGNFGSCCKELSEAFSVPNVSLFRIEENGVLYLTIGSVEVEGRTAWLDQAVIFCPFCGVVLQNRDEIAAAAGRQDGNNLIN